MPRRKRNARITKHKRLKYCRAELVKINKSKVETMSPGILMAVAEWRESYD